MNGIQDCQKSEFVQDVSPLTGIELKKQKQKENHEIWKSANKDKIKKYSKEYLLVHKEKIYEYHKKYVALHKEELKERRRKYNLAHKEQNKISRKRYYEEHRKEEIEKVEKYNLEHQEHIADYRRNRYWENREEEGIRARAYQKTAAGKLSKARQHSKRKRELGFKPLNTWFKDSEGHHIGKECVIFIPKALHKSIGHNLLQNRNMKAINSVALDYLFTSATI